MVVLSTVKWVRETGTDEVGLSLARFCVPLGVMQRNLVFAEGEGGSWVHKTGSRSDWCFHEWVLTGSSGKDGEMGLWDKIHTTVRVNQEDGPASGCQASFLEIPEYMVTGSLQALALWCLPWLLSVFWFAVLLEEEMHIDGDVLKDGIWQEILRTKMEESANKTRQSLWKSYR